jgi:para-nitrobenzyl esterase
MTDTLLSPAAKLDPAPVVQTDSGKVQGQPSKGVYSFLGMRYGAPTGGKGRFKPPTKPAPWDGVFKADHFGDRAPQPVVNMAPEMATVLSFADEPISEDCLRLNVWTPALGDGGKRPVMVWLHGGGFFVGAGSDKYYEGSNLARGQDVVVVTLNHRLNVFGYMNLDPEAGPEFADSGMVGMLDLVLALEWVRDNIEQFGGDPGNVTIYGQSGGGGKVCVLTAMPAAKGLFHKAIVQSGASTRVGEAPDSLATRDKVLAKVGLGPSDVQALQDMPMEALLAQAAQAGLLAFMPHVDGRNLPAHPFDPVASPLSADVPIMVGWTKDEATNLFLSDPSWPAMTDAELLAKVTAMVGEERAKTAIALYRSRAPDDKPMHLWTSIVTDQMFAANSLILAERKIAQHAAPAYVYVVDWDSPVLGGKLRAFHAVEMPFVFDTLEVSSGLVGPEGPEQKAMAKAMSSAWAAFARAGDPNVPGQPQWAAYSLGQRDTMVFDNTLAVKSDPSHDVRLFWEETARLAAEKAPLGSAIQDVFKKKSFG